MNYDDMYWCDDCGRPHPRNPSRPLPRQLTVRRRLVGPITRPLYRLSGWCLMLAERIVAWADKPEREKYDDALKRERYN
jgi:hypothetical protein